MRRRERESEEMQSFDQEKAYDNQATHTHTHLTKRNCNATEYRIHHHSYGITSSTKRFKMSAKPYSDGKK